MAKNHRSRLRAKKRERRRLGRHEHRSALRGEQRRRALRLGEPVAFVWECNDPKCTLGHR